MRVPFAPPFRRFIPAALLLLFFGNAFYRPVAVQGAPVGLSDLKIEYKTDPIGIDVQSPRMSWQIESGERGAAQTAYQIRVAEAPGALRSGRRLLWDTGKVTSDQSIHVPYEGPALQSGKRYYWQVRVWDRNGTASAWSAPAYWEMGLLDPGDWKAAWIEPAILEDTSKAGPAPMLRKEFTLRGEVASARLYATAHGLYEMHINGRRVGDEVFTPGWTAYDERLQYQTYDVTDLLRRGENAVGAYLGDGWYRGYLAWGDRRNHYGAYLALLAQIEVVYKNGSREIIATDGSWKASTGPIVMSDIYNGEAYDARLEKDGWATPRYDDAAWSGVRVAEHPKDILVAPAGPPVLKIEELRPVRIITTPEGDTVVDMGQNMVGWARISAEGPSGTLIEMTFFEVLDKQGNVYLDNLRDAAQTDRFILAGDGVETFEPHFTFHGFQFIRVKGYPGELTPEKITGVVIHSDITPSGRLETNKPLVNQLQHNIIWGQKGNFLDVPTDCPQRDERLGWTGDAQVFARTAALNHDVAGFFTKWLADLAADQRDDGSVPHVIPDVLSRGQREGKSSAAWADAAVIVPWTMYLSYGDERILEQQYPSMKQWVEYMRRQAGDTYLWTNGTHYGDWLAFATTRSDYPGATTDKDLIATAFYAHSADLLRKTAEVLGKDNERREYADVFEKVKAAFLREYVTQTGRMSSNTQTAYALALQFDLLPEALRPEAARRLAEDIRRMGNHLTAGFVGSSYLTPVLTRYGYLDVAYTLLNREDYPSWLYPVKMGATTIWERWDGIKPDGSFQNPGMNSFNHYAYGAVGEWMYRVMAGIDIDPERPGYKHILFAPQPGGGFTEVDAEVESMYGTVASGWKLDGNRYTLKVQAPPNTTATVRLPRATLAGVREGGAAVSAAPGVKTARQDGADVLVEIGSGAYTFVYDSPALSERVSAR